MPITLELGCTENKVYIWLYMVMCSIALQVGSQTFDYGEVIQLLVNKMQLKWKRVKRRMGVGWYT